MMLIDWIKGHVIAHLMPDVKSDVDDDLYDWLEREQAALRARLEADRGLITRREGRPARDRPEDAR